MKQKVNSRRWFIIRFLTPAVLCFLFIYLYPAIRTLTMSFFNIEYVTDDLSDGFFVGIQNYQKLFSSALFQTAIKNMFKIWFGGGVCILAISILLAVILTSGVKWKNFWRAVLYIPHIISVVALVTMWTQYAFNNQYGLFKKLFEFLRFEALAELQWTSPEHLFLSMMIAYAYAGIGYYVLILVAGIDGIPKEYYEAALIDGANVWQRFRFVTMPQLRDIFKRCVVLYSASAIGFFSYASLFSFEVQTATITPIVYMYESVFGASNFSASTQLNVGAGASVGVIVMVLVVTVNTVLNKLVKSDADLQ